MTHRFPIKEIAAQAGVGTATVDRVLNARAHVSPQTRRRVAAAVRELERQETQLSARGRRVFIDLLVEAPRRFTGELQRAAEAAARAHAGAVIRPRFLFQEVMRTEDALAHLARIRARGSQGVCLKLRDVAPIRAAVADLAQAGVPVVTLATDLATPARRAYVGLRNGSAGRTAALLIAQVLGPAARGTVLTTRSQDSFLGEEERARAFRNGIAQRCPGLRLVEVAGGSGLAPRTAPRISAAGRALTDLQAVYSMGGGNDAILRALGEVSQHPRFYVAHDLDAENRALLAAGRIDIVLHHDLQADLATAFRTLTQGATGAEDLRADVQIVTAENIPRRP